MFDDIFYLKSTVFLLVSSLCTRMLLLPVVLLLLLVLFDRVDIIDNVRDDGDDDGENAPLQNEMYV